MILLIPARGQQRIDLWAGWPNLDNEINGIETLCSAIDIHGAQRRRPPPLLAWIAQQTTA